MSTYSSFALFCFAYDFRLCCCSRLVVWSSFFRSRLPAPNWTNIQAAKRQPGKWRTYACFQIDLMGRSRRSVGSFLLKLYWKDISKMEMVLFCFMGRQSNPNLTDSSPGNLDFHDFLTFGTLSNPYLWIWICRIRPTGPCLPDPRVPRDLGVWIFALGVLGCGYPDIRISRRNFKILKRGKGLFRGSRFLIAHRFPTGGSCRILYKQDVGNYRKIIGNYRKIWFLFVRFAFFGYVIIN